MKTEDFVVFKVNSQWVARKGDEVIPLVTASIVKREDNMAIINCSSHKKFPNQVIDEKSENKNGFELTPIQSMMIRMFIKICIRIINDEALNRVCISWNNLKESFSFLKSDFFSDGFNCNMATSVDGFSLSMSEENNVLFEKKVAK